MPDRAEPRSVTLADGVEAVEGDACHVIRLDEVEEMRIVALTLTQAERDLQLGPTVVTRGGAFRPRQLYGRKEAAARELARQLDWEAGYLAARAAKCAAALQAVREWLALHAPSPKAEGQSDAA